MSHAAKITSKGQITIPAKLREQLGVGPGDHLNFIEAEDGTIIVEKGSVALSDLREMLSDLPRLTPEQAVEAVQDARASAGDDVIRTLQGQSE